MRIDLDANILLRQIEPGHTQFQVTLDALRILDSSGHELCIVPQNLYEFWTASTRPIRVNGLGKSAIEATLDCKRFQTLFPLYPDNFAVLPEWLNLVSAHNVLGKQAHDARIAAAMGVHGITHILTFNGADFARYPAVTALDPHAVAAGTSP